MLNLRLLLMPAKMKLGTHDNVTAINTEHVILYQALSRQEGAETGFKYFVWFKESIMQQSFTQMLSALLTPNYSFTVYLYGPRIQTWQGGMAESMILRYLKDDGYSHSKYSWKSRRLVGNNWKRISCHIFWLNVSKPISVISNITRLFCNSCYYTEHATHA